MSDIKWTMERYSGQKEKILKLRKIVFKGEDEDKVNVDFWNWEFEDNYAGHADIFLAVDGQEVVGHYAVCPSNILVNSELKKGSIVVDVMTHPDYRFQGMFTKLGAYSLEESGKDGIDFSYGFPIRKSVMPGHLKIGWKVGFKLPVYVYPVSFSKTIQKFIPSKPVAAVLGFIPQMVYRMVGGIRSAFGKKYAVKEAEGFEDTKELREFIEATKTQHKIMQYRNYEFLNWRYNINHYREYRVFFAYGSNGKILGYIVLRNSLIYDLQCTTIIDIQARDCSKSVINALLLCAYKHAAGSKNALIGCMINQNKYKTQMLKNLFLKSPYIFKFIFHVNRDIDYMEELSKSENWFITWADTDDL